MRNNREQHAYEAGKASYNPSDHDEEYNDYYISNALIEIDTDKDALINFERTPDGRIWAPDGSWSYENEEEVHEYIAYYQGILSRFD